MSCRNESIVFGDRVATNTNFSIRLEQSIPFESRSNMSTMMSPKTCVDIGTRCNAKEQEQISSVPALIFIGLYLWILPHDFYFLEKPPQKCEGSQKLNYDCLFQAWTTVSIPMP